ncbi:CaiF/GrlA family transcriptional regulator [Serratia marcescens]|uniref:CaiF/GrlA family transcriptional regulator n=1 Tax=Serratia marcescens TaxID=615 RepID=UPI000E3D7655|nr:CaiF/GrlA family transcriptional regulator [Serratia marcescens]NGH10028.1 CaiF/GrlA family transcriptional regulator [Serratia marcescens]RFT77739.1 CaiF/GrlA family transcriptional regulator [Serratia marcescens]TFZ80356.1 CaiF/GrlA family transcriptional regulator [Serratia marcescens]
MSRENANKENMGAQFTAGEKKRIAPRQSNHEEYTLPDCLVNYPSMPLYLAVAHFGLLTQQILSREVICQAFHIDTRRALEVMRYLVNGAPSVTCECLSLIQRRGYCLRVLSIASGESAAESAHPPSSRTSARKRGSTLERERAQHQVRQWFLRRPNP